MHENAREVMENSLRQGLLSYARALAGVVDPDQHSQFTRREQETSPEYLQQLVALDTLKRALDVKGMVKYVYTCVLHDGEVRLVLDTTPEGDADGDGQDDKAHILDPYPEASHTLRRTLEKGVPAVDSIPYTDRWGTFLSAYAPVFNSAREVVACLGVDVELTDFNAQLASLHTAELLHFVGAFSLSLLAGIFMYIYHLRLRVAVGDLTTAEMAAQASSRAKSDFLATMSHELRTPMNAVLGMIQLLQKANLKPVEHEYLKTAYEVGDRLMTMINDILDFSQIDVGTIALVRDRVDLPALLEDVTASVRDEARLRKLDLTAHIAPGCPTLFWGDNTRLRQLLRHVVGNAVKFTDSGYVRITAKVVLPGEIQFKIEDTGVGIGKENQEALFDAFYQSDSSIRRRHGGTGLGLAISKRLCDAMKGRIWFESEVGRGTTFHIALPGEPVMEPPQGEAKAPEGAGSRSVLLATDDDLVQLLVAGVARKMELPIHSVTTASDLPASVEAEDARYVMVDASILDAPTVEWVREQRKKIRKNSVQYCLLNATAGDTRNEAFHHVLTSPLKPSTIRETLTHPV